MPSDYLFDASRKDRTGLDEAVLCLSKTPGQVSEAIAYAQREGLRMLFTRLDPDKAARIPKELQKELDYDDASGTGIVGGVVEPVAPARVAIVSAGTSDVQVAGEASRTLAYFGEASTPFTDVGVAGLWRLLERRDAIASHPIVIALAGMEGALFSVLGGLICSVLIAVPTSVGYGVSAGGKTALEAALGSCSPGVLTVNIDNGYGAACAALRVLHTRSPKAPGKGVADSGCDR
jgi:NCAIR mutase (PurE)-related protein